MSAGAQAGAQNSSSPRSARRFDDVHSAGTPLRSSRPAMSPRTLGKFQKAAAAAREVALNDAASAHEKLSLPRGYGVPGVKWTARDLVKRVNRMKELVHPSVHPTEEPQIWQAAWEAVMQAFEQLRGTNISAEVKECEVDPVQAALDWELDDDAVPKNAYHLSVTWRPMRKRGGRGKKGQLPDRIRVHVVKAWIDRAKRFEPTLREVGFLAPPPSCALYGERGEENQQYHGQGKLLWLSNGTADTAVLGATAFLEACMLVHPEVNNSAELLVKPVGPSALDEDDVRPIEIIDWYPLKESHLPHSYGFDNYPPEYRERVLQKGKEYNATAGTTGYRKAGHTFRNEGRYENKIERKNMVTLTHLHTLRTKASILGASFIRELCWLFQRGDHVLDPGVIVYGSTIQDLIKIEALNRLNANKNYAATTTMMHIVIDHGQPRLHAHEKLWPALKKRPPWMIPAKIVNDLDCNEMDEYVVSAKIPMRWLSVARAPFKEASNEANAKPSYLGASMIVDLNAGDICPGSVQLMDAFARIKYQPTLHMHEHTGALDQTGDLALAYLAHVLKEMPEDVSLFGNERTFRGAVSLVDLLQSCSQDYHHIVHEHYLRRVRSNDSHARLQAIFHSLQLPDLLERYNAIWHGAISVRKALTLIEMTTNAADADFFEPRMQCAIVYGEVQNVAPGMSAASGLAGPAAPQMHYFAIAWEAWAEPQQEVNQNVD